jgi:hypothetical protein
MGFGSGFSGSKTGGLRVVSGSDGQVLRFHGGGKAVIGTSDLTYSDTDGFNVSGNIQHSGNIEPANDGVHTIGSSEKTYLNSNIQDIYASNVYTGDFHMKNERGDWTIFEEKTSLIVQNNLTGQRFKLVMEEIED